MLKWYKNLYIGENVKQKVNKYKKKVNKGIGVIDVYLLTLASNEQNQLDILSANALLQKHLHTTCPLIVGIAKGYEEAIALFIQISEEIYEKTGDVDIRSFIIEQEGCRICNR